MGWNKIIKLRTRSLDDSDDETCSTEVTTTAQIQTQAEKRVQLATLEEEIKVSKVSNFGNIFLY